MNSDNAMALFIVGLVLFVLMIGILQPKFEADAYSRLTGKKVGYWDALWLDLRVQEQINK